MHTVQAPVPAKYFPKPEFLFGNEWEAAKKMTKEEGLGSVQQFLSMQRANCQPDRIYCDLEHVCEGWIVLS